MLRWSNAEEGKGYLGKDICFDFTAKSACLQGGHIALKYLFQASVAPAACIALSTWLEPSFNKQVSTAYSCKSSLLNVPCAKRETWCYWLLGVWGYAVCDRGLQGSKDIPGARHGRPIAACAIGTEHSSPF